MKEMDDKFEIIKTQRGNNCALHEGYRYHYKKIHKNNNMFWRCVWNKKCNGSMISNNSKVIKVNKHTCLPNHIENEKMKIFHRCVAETDPRTTSASDLHKEIVQELKNSCLDVDGNVPTKKQVWRRYHKSKKEHK